MKTSLAAIAILALSAAPAVWAEEHLLDPAAAQRQMLDSVAARDRNLGAVGAFVASAEASSALAAAGLDATRVRGAIATLDDSELQQIADRVAALDRDPVAGAAFSGRQIGWALAIVLIVGMIIIIA